VRIRGRVQGVGFRYLAAQRARSLGVSGWVRNERDGAVSAAFQGPAELVESMLDWCRRGPAGSRVDDVAVTWEQPTRDSGFEIRW
jgi:acylphosphatase